jgi:hypothetical protein
MKHCSAAHDWELYVSRACLGSIFIDVLDPFVMTLQSIRGNADDFDVSLCEVC